MPSSTVHLGADAASGTRSAATAVVAGIAASSPRHPATRTPRPINNPPAPVARAPDSQRANYQQQHPKGINVLLSSMRLLHSVFSGEKLVTKLVGDPVDNVLIGRRRILGNGWLRLL